MKFKALYDQTGGYNLITYFIISKVFHFNILLMRFVTFLIYLAIPFIFVSLMDKILNMERKRKICFTTNFNNTSIKLC